MTKKDYFLIANAIRFADHAMCVRWTASVREYRKWLVDNLVEKMNMDNVRFDEQRFREFLEITN
jgi:hypothetical protein